MSHANIDKIVPIYSTLEELEMEKAFLEVNEAIEGNLGIRIEATDRYTAIALTGGRLSIAFHKDLQQLLTDQLETGCHFIFDCKNLADIDSIGLGLLVEFAKKVQEKKGLVTVIRLNDIISDLFNLFQLNSLIKTFPNIEDAVEFFKEQETGKKG
jgi:anti-anti-sigma factor